MIVSAIFILLKQGLVVDIIIFRGDRDDLNLPRRRSNVALPGWYRLSWYVTPTSKYFVVDLLLSIFVIDFSARGPPILYHCGNVRQWHTCTVLSEMGYAHEFVTISIWISSLVDWEGVPNHPAQNAWQLWYVHFCAPSRRNLDASRVNLKSPAFKEVTARVL